MELETQCRDWIAAVVGEPFPEGSFHEALKDGLLLCRLVVELVYTITSYELPKSRCRADEEPVRSVIKNLLKTNY